MAKRKRLEAPSADALKEFEEGFARETSSSGALGPTPPIAQGGRRSLSRCLRSQSLSPRTNKGKT